MALNRLLVLGLLVLGSSLARGAELTVYTYDAFTAKGALGPVVASEMESKAKVKVHLVGFPSAGEALNQIAIEGEHTHADVLVGVDEGLVARARALKAFAPAGRELLASVPSALRFDEDGTFVPFDFGYLSLVYDSARGTKVPEKLSLGDVATLPAFRKKIVIEDPRTSSLGLSFLLWTGAVAGNSFAKLWDQLGHQIVTVAPGWTGAYLLFLKREADFVVSYTTSPAYHVEKEKKDSFRAIAFSDGNFRQTETAALVKSSRQHALGKRFLELLLSAGIQARIPTTQWMYPARDGIQLPASFNGLVKVSRPVTLTPERIAERSAGWLREWTEHMARSR